MLTKSQGYTVEVEEEEEVLLASSAYQDLRSESVHKKFYYFKIPLFSLETKLFIFEGDCLPVWMVVHFTVSKTEKIVFFLLTR